MLTLLCLRKKSAVLSLILFFVLFFSSAYATEIKVQLFGQPCLLIETAELTVSRITENQLKTIHSISPEQLPPPTTVDEARKLKTKIQAGGKIPASLDRYHDLILKRVDGLIVFFQAAAKFKQNKNASQLLGSVKPFLNERRVKNFDRELKRYHGKNAPAKITEPMLEELRDYYEENSNFPTTTVEEEFHRAIARMNIRYQCTFEEIGDDDDETE